MAPTRAGALLSILPLLFVALPGCTVHPPGEASERSAALNVGKPYAHRLESRQLPPLSDHPSLDDLIKRGLLANAGLEQQYWEWRSAIEQIPQDGTQATNLVVYAGANLVNGAAALSRTTLTAANDPMNDIVWPSKLSAAARRALENARAAGLRFVKAKYELRANVISAYEDYALSGELIALEQSNVQLLRTTSMVVEARNRAGAAGQPDVLKASNELDLSQNEIAAMQAQLPAQRSALNALLSRPPDALLAVPDEFPTSGAIAYSDQQFLDLAAKRNPDLAALASEIRGRQDGLQLARLQYFPDFSLSAASDLQGITQSLSGMITVPLLRHEAIDAAIAQAQANLRAAEAMRRQSANDLNARVVLDLSTLRDADRQLALFKQSLLPRARQIVTVERSSYEAGRASLLDLLDSQRSLISIQRGVADLRATRDKRLADLEAVAAMRLTGIIPDHGNPNPGHHP
ncbi:MAG TPA: TolC family protein [Tepidisphaeraceae bacterium]|nr:TolC family protein [Tepidisphaeraceae bacterium]